MSSYPFPITGAKIHPPLLRSDTLSRPRLNDWLDGAAGGRVVLIVAEAGFGKTTLLGDWASRSERRTAWYRLEPDDADWLVFLRHLVAAGRELDDGFGTETLDLLLALGAGGPQRGDIVATLVREYADFAATLPGGLTVIFDDHHVIDGSAETDAILRALIDRTGEGLSIVIASRTVPNLPLGRLRARGSLSRLDGEDLCFDVPETERLFREAYHHPLEPDVITELIKRTEGWAALLTLVRTSLEDKDAPEARALVAQLSATRGDLYDFLAEEVLATLSPDLQRFLTRVAVLVSVDPETGALVDDVSPADLVPLIAAAESLGLLTRPDRESPHRFHPLVRDFLLARLTDEIGSPAVRELHHRVAVALEPTDWLGSAWHYREAGLPHDAARVIDRALPTILAAGSFELSVSFLDGSAGAADRTAALILRSRLELARGNLDRARELGEQAARSATDDASEPTALLNLATLHGLSGFGSSSLSFATQAQRTAVNRVQSSIAEAFLLMGSLAEEGDLQLAADELRFLASQQERDELPWYRAVTLLNLAVTLEWAGDLDGALVAATAADDQMARLRSRGVERAAAMATKAVAQFLLGMPNAAEQTIDGALRLPSSLARSEAAVEASRLYAAYGQVSSAVSAIGAAAADPAVAASGPALLAHGELSLRTGDLAAARIWLSKLEEAPCGDVCGLLRTRLLAARIAIAARDPGARSLAEGARRVARVQRARPSERAADVLVAISEGALIHTEVIRSAGDASYSLSIVAEAVAGAADRLTDEALAVVRAEILKRPRRWSDVLMHVVAGASEASVRCADLLVEVGNSEDARALRRMAVGDKRLRPAALRLTNRLAEPVFISDLGRVDVQLGASQLRVVRRKVLGLLCYLVSRPTMAATRDEVLEALWPELGPDTAGNSLHQTIYFLRRAFEPDYREGLSAGYVLYDGEVVNLAQGLVDSRSRRCWRLVTECATNPLALSTLLDEYSGKFALDFAYEDWAADYRDHLHAAVLAAAESGMVRSHQSGDYEQEIRIGHRVLALDPEADVVELALLRAYKAGGRQAAAAEQYAHYATFLREELGAEPPPFEDL